MSFHSNRPPGREPPAIPPRPNDNAPPKNQTLLQGFEWHCPADNKHWQRLAKAVPNLTRMGITSMWIPPACKAFWTGSAGYDMYDLYDLGEFDWKGAQPTKYGTKDELLSFMQVADANGLKIIFDAIVNHKAGADYSEPQRGIRVDPNDRRIEISGLEDIETWTGFNFPGRNGKYSTFHWNKSHFSGVDYDHKSRRANSIWKFEGKNWARDVDTDFGNFDYLMHANIDLQNEEVRQELFRWITWLSGHLKLGGMRLDAVKHLPRSFVRDFLKHIRETFGPDFYIVGDYWMNDSKYLALVIDYMDHQMALYDVRLLNNFRDLSQAEQPDLRTVFKDTLANLEPDHALTFVATHDSQEGQECETLIKPWFIPIAYALILLRSNSGTPCVFYGDLYGSFGPNSGREAGTFEPPPFHWPISRMILARQLFAYGAQTDYFDEPNCIGFTRQGHPSHSGHAGLAVVMTSSSKSTAKKMFVGAHHGGERWVDLLRGTGGEVTIDAGGWATFPVGPRKVAIWLDIGALERQSVDQLAFDHDIYRLKTYDLQH